MPDEAANMDPNNGQRISKIELVRQDVEYLVSNFKEWREETQRWRESVDRRIRYLEDDKTARDALETAGKNVTWPHLKDKFVIPAVNYAIALAIGWIVLKVTGQIP